MKKILLFAAALAFSGLTARAWAQSADAENPDLERIQGGFVVAPDFKLSEMDGRSANLLGGYAGWLTDRKLFIGAGAYWLTNGAAGSELAYGGALVEWFPQRNEKFNLSFRGLVGAGTGSLGVDIGDLGDFPEAPESRFGGRGEWDHRFPHRFPSTILVHEGFFVAEPQANGSFTFTHWLRLGVGAGYRLIGGASGLESRFRGPTASVSLQFGKFY